ncbi:MAG: CvpA family protein [Alphaproteobacteria bacterium]|nr:CvpA family protein [Alphaproteobacteria bacterium]
MEKTSYNAFDLLFLAILLVSGIFALRRGLVREVLALGSWILAALFAFALFSTVRPLLDEYIKNKMLADAATGVGLFCVAIIILVPLGDFVSSLVRSPKLSAIDRSLGFVFGLIRGFIIMSLVYLSLTFVFPEEPEGKVHQPPWLEKSKTKPVLAYGVDLLKSLVPEGADEKLAEALKKKQKAEKEAAEDAAEHLDELSTPVPEVSGFKGEDSSYDDKERERMDEIFDE